MISVITALLWDNGKRDATVRLESFKMDLLSGMLSIFCADTAVRFFETPYREPVGAQIAAVAGCVRVGWFGQE